MVRIGAKNLPEEYERFGSRYFTLKRIKAATQNFSPANKIGESGFGPVYKGVLQDPDETTIAVKILYFGKSEQGRIEFLKEVHSTSTLRHSNLVNLLGYCTQKNQLLLVYQYMENGCLAKALFGTDQSLKGRFNWQTRIKICLGIAKGLAFLHDEEIIHGHIKLSNLFLDKDLNPRISDFGLAKFYKKEEEEEEEEPHVNNGLAATMGYTAPEYAAGGILTDKADVYSFGVVTLELISGRRNIPYPLVISSESLFLVDLAYILQKEGDLLSLIDRELKTTISVKQATLVLDLAMLCIVESPTSRPTMSEVVNILEGRTIMNSPPVLKSNYLLEVDSKGAMSEMTSNHQLGSKLTKLKGTPLGYVFGPKEPIAILSSDVASTEEDDTHTEFHVDLVSDLMSSMGEGEEDPSVVLPFHVASIEDEDNAHPAFQCGFISDVNSSMGDDTEDGAAVLSSHFVLKEEEDNIRTTFHVDCDSEVKDSMGEGGQDARLFMHANVATPESPKLNAMAWMDATNMEDESELEYVEPFVQDGKHHIKCSVEELKIGCSEWEDSLVGYFLGEKAPFMNMEKETVEKLWDVTGNVSVFSMGNGYFLFRFSCIEDKIRVLESSSIWLIEERLLVLRKWDWKLKFDSTEIKCLPVWVKIYKLPLFLWSSSFLSKVGSGLGIPLYVDQKTKNRERLDYARLCIKVDAYKPLPESWNISVHGIDYQLNLEYDWKPFRCTNCCTFGHLESNCRLKTKETKQN